jgi:hypothetical protein
MSFEIAEANANGSQFLKHSLIIRCKLMGPVEEQFCVVQNVGGCGVERGMHAGIHAFSGSLQKQAKTQEFGRGLRLPGKCQLGLLRGFSGQLLSGVGVVGSYWSCEQADKVSGWGCGRGCGIGAGGGGRGGGAEDRVLILLESWQREEDGYGKGDGEHDWNADFEGSVSGLWSPGTGSGSEPVIEGSGEMAGGLVAVCGVFPKAFQADATEFCGHMWLELFRWCGQLPEDGVKELILGYVWQRRLACKECVEEAAEAVDICGGGQVIGSEE